MPIRMVKDEENLSPNYNDNNNDGGRRGGSNPMMGCLPLILGLLFKRPKLLIPLILLACVGYFFFSKMGGSLSGDNGGLTRGGEMDPAKYDKVEVYEALADNVNNPMPEHISLEQYAPKRLNQGSQGSCVAWSSAYAARSIMEAKATGKDPNSTAFSPAFLYNAIHLDNCQGAYINEAMEVMKKYGAVPFSEMPYDENDCSTQPNQYHLQKASAFKTRGYQRLTKTGDDQSPDLLAIKQNLAAGAPVVIGMMVGGSFMQAMRGQEVWIPNTDDYGMYGFGGHAMCCIGYDDYKEGGAFQIMNSWGNDWGVKGIAWVRYSDFKNFVKEAYGLYPMGDAYAPDKAAILNINLGLYNVATQQNIPLKKLKDHMYTTTSAIAADTKFKIMVTNTVECYTYIFGQETDGSSYTLFPYTPKHSPFCGIAGMRLFPKDYSLQPDKVGNTDYMAIVISKQPLDYNELNKTISQAPGQSYYDKLNIALGGSSIQQVNFSDQNQYISVQSNAASEGTIGIVIEVKKQ